MTHVSWTVQEILKAHQATNNISAGGYYIDQETLKKEFQSSLVANITNSQVLHARPCLSYLGGGFTLRLHL